MSRITKEQYYLNIAEAISLRSSCLRAQCGAIIVQNDNIIATGYNGNPRGVDNCCDIGTCPRENYKPQEGNHLCQAVHAEMNALLSLARNGGASSIGSTLYVWFKRTDNSVNTYNKPCDSCMKHIKNAGIERIVNRNEDNIKITLDITDSKWDTVRRYYLKKEENETA